MWVVPSFRFLGKQPQCLKINKCCMGKIFKVLYREKDNSLWCTIIIYYSIKFVLRFSYYSHAPPTPSSNPILKQWLNQTIIYRVFFRKRNRSDLFLDWWVLFLNKFKLIFIFVKIKVNIQIKKHLTRIYFDLKYNLGLNLAATRLLVWMLELKVSKTLKFYVYMN